MLDVLKDHFRSPESRLIPGVKRTHRGRGAAADDTAMIATPAGQHSRNRVAQPVPDMDMAGHIPVPEDGAYHAIIMLNHNVTEVGRDIGKRILPHLALSDLSNVMIKHY